MSDYKNGDTASWDASQVRRSQAGHTGGARAIVPLAQPASLPPVFDLCLCACCRPRPSWLAWAGCWPATCAFSRDIPSTTKITIEITADDDMGSIAEKLQDAGLIRYKWFFRLFAAVTGASESGHRHP
ncbi:MAG: hypothetical protein ACLTYN_14185 [Dysosmobacter welbionis]